MGMSGTFKLLGNVSFMMDMFSLQNMYFYIDFIFYCEPVIVTAAS